MDYDLLLKQSKELISDSNKFNSNKEYDTFREEMISKYNYLL